jgi:outer membrane protein OmpA-like peptidoglycan-associated protein
MTSRALYSALLLSTLGALAIAGCKRKEAEATVAPTAVVAASAPATNAAQAPAAAKAFDITSVPMSSATIPPFPYVEMPAGTDGYHKDSKDFDRAWVIAGDELRAVEGRTSERWFPPSAVKMSMLSAFRNYETAIKSMGGVRVDTVHPIDPGFIARNGGDKEAVLKKLAIPNSHLTQPGDTPTFAQYLVRTPQGNIWIALFFFDDDLNMSIEVVHEKAMEQTVALVKADAMAAALAKDGHIALYLNFDNDSDVIRDDSKAAIDEIAKMMAADASLKVRVEGHTDNNGKAAHNTTLSRARAESVVKAISAKQIARDRLMPEGVGADRPLADNSNEEGRAKNRRVELVKI